MRALIPPLNPTERRWAALAHASAVLTAGLGLAAGGWGAALALLAPLAMFLGARPRAPGAALHALQAVVFQAGAAVAYVLGALLALAVAAAAWLVGLILVWTPAGWLIWPALLTLTLVVAAGLLGAPVAGLACALTAAWRVWRGTPFLYPLAGPLAAWALSLEAGRE